MKIRCDHYSVLVKYIFDKDHEPVVGICENLGSLLRSSQVLLTEFNKSDALLPFSCLGYPVLEYGIAVRQTVPKKKKARSGEELVVRLSQQWS